MLRKSRMPRNRFIFAIIVQRFRPHEEPVVIFIRKGRYEERVRIGQEKRQVHLVGEDRKAR